VRAGGRTTASDCALAGIAVKTGVAASRIAITLFFMDQDMQDSCLILQVQPAMRQSCETILRKASDRAPDMNNTRLFVNFCGGIPVIREKRPQQLRNRVTVLPHCLNSPWGKSNTTGEFTMFFFKKRSSAKQTTSTSRPVPTLQLRHRAVAGRIYRTVMHLRPISTVPPQSLLTSAPANRIHL